MEKASFLVLYFALFVLSSGPLYGERPTVCTATINSPDEGEIFQTYLKKDFDFLELTGLGGGKDWFHQACLRNVQCDILLISGHFGGVFFGESGYRLSQDELQRRACQPACDGILKRPKEVFLFGCNTTAGKEPDRRTPQQYVRDLVEDGFSRSLAEQVATFRYSPVGQRTRDRMRQVFPNARIYGFHSKAPLGFQMRGRLRKYFGSIPGGDYLGHMEGLTPGRENRFWSGAMKGLYVRSVSGDPKMENPVCVLEGDGPLYKKLDWINEVISDRNRALAYIPMLDDYLKELEGKFGSWEEIPTGELVLLESIQFNHGAKERVLEILQVPHRGLLGPRVQILNFSKRVGWHGEAEYRADLKKLLGGMFRRNLNWEGRDSLCSMGVELDLALEDLPPSSWNAYTIFALGCVRPQDPRIHRRLAGMLANPQERVRKATLWALGETGTDDPEIQGKVVELLESGSRLVRARAGRALVKMKPRNPGVYQSMVDLLKDPGLRPKVSWVLEKIRPGGPGGYAPLVELLKEDDGGIRSVASWILKRHRPDGLEFRRSLVRLLEHPSPKVCSTVSLLLDALKPHEERVYELIEELLKENKGGLCAGVSLLVKKKT